MSRRAPVLDWLTLADLERDPFPAWEQMRAEGGVHWVPAVSRYFITSYAAAHAALLDQATFSADVHDSIQVHAWGHSLVRRDDPAHQRERRAWQPPFQPGAVMRAWTAVFERNAARYLNELIAKGPGADLIWDFAAPYAGENLRELLGFHNVTQHDLQRWSQSLIDATSNYARDPEVSARGARAVAEVDSALDEMLSWHADHASPADHSLIASLLRLTNSELSLDQIRANLKATIAGGMNEPRDALGVTAWALLSHPTQRRAVEADPSLWPSAFDEAIRRNAPVGALTRQLTRDTVLAGVELPSGAKLAICVDSANRDESVWSNASSFDIRREVRPHLAFGRGVHACLGVWVAKAEVASVALPMLFGRVRGLALDPDQTAEIGGWPFRGMLQLPVIWSGTGAARQRDPTPPMSAAAPTVAIVGAGPSGCFTAQAVRRTFPDARIDVFDRLPVPYGLVRYGVAADHQGTKSVTRQFERLFTHDGVTFHGNVTIGEGVSGADVDLATLREAFDAVVLATGLREDAPLGIPGAEPPRVLGSGRLTRALNGYPDEERLPPLGRDVVVVGHGNVAIDVVRLLTRDVEGFAGSDVHDQVHERLVRDLRTVHVVGRSQPTAAKFDAVMVRELATMRGVAHTVHGLDACDTLPGKDARVDALRELTRLAPDDANVRVEWWFGQTPIEIEHKPRDPICVEADRPAPHAAIDIGGSVLPECASPDRSPAHPDPRHTPPDVGRVLAVHLADTAGVRTRLAADTVVTAIGFRADNETHVAPGEHPTGRIEPGLYVAGWLRRGPRGTIPTQRDDAHRLARLLADDFASGALDATKPGRSSLGDLAGAVDFDGWRRIDRHETTTAAPGRVRAKLCTHDTLLAAARDDTIELPAVEPVGSSHSGSMFAIGEPITIAYGTESGTGELVAAELRSCFADHTPVDLVDLADLSPAQLDPNRLHLMICSTYGDGELPTNARAFRDALVTEHPDLTGLRYAVFGLGDRSYVSTYSRGSELLDETLSALGATRIGEYGRFDASSTDDVTERAADWLAGVLAEARAGASVV